MTVRAIIAPDGVRLHTRSDGDSAAPPLLLLNSLGTDLSMWDEQVQGWSASHHVLRFDQRGHGRSDAPDGAYTLEQLGRDARAVLDAHEVRRAHVCGLSIGGMVALWLAASAPARVRRAVFADTAARVGTEQAWRTRAATVRGEGMAAITDLVLARFFSPAFRASNHPAVARLERGLRAAPVAGYAGSCDALAVGDLRALVPRIRAPSLVIVGTADEATPPADAHALQALLPDAELAELPGAGHLANLEQPARFEQLVREFLSRPDPGVSHA
jgi:3-oxoadipate enol-lactonase